MSQFTMSGQFGLKNFIWISPTLHQNNFFAPKLLLTFFLRTSINILCFCHSPVNFRAHSAPSRSLPLPPAPSRSLPLTPAHSRSLCSLPHTSAHSRSLRSPPLTPAHSAPSCSLPLTPACADARILRGEGQKPSGCRRQSCGRRSSMEFWELKK